MHLLKKFRKNQVFLIQYNSRQKFCHWQPSVLILQLNFKFHISKMLAMESSCSPCQSFNVLATYLTKLALMQNDAMISLNSFARIDCLVNFTNILLAAFINFTSKNAQK
jgi:hypothetical protein